LWVIVEALRAGKIIRVKVKTDGGERGGNSGLGVEGSKVRGEF
jgi:hypothetical protein